jgi:hypothetical protein
MKLPKIDLSTLPDLDTATGMFGSLMGGRGHDDSLIILATYIYETIPPGG